LDTIPQKNSPTNRAIIRENSPSVQPLCREMSVIMLYFLPAPLLGVLASALMLLNILLWVPILLSVSIIKLLLPFKAVRLAVDPLLLRIAEAWIAGNSGWMRLTQKLDWEVSGINDLSPRQWYLVVCNHQSWVDILVLQHVLNRRIPLLKFFLKKELIWVPIMGLAWWALEFPFMRRHSEAYLKQHPEERGKDAATTRKACEKYALVPTSVMNFLEGTRCTPAKQQRQQSPYQHLLKPKAGGVTLALDAMGDKFGAVLDITIVYPDGRPAFTQFLMGRVKNVVVQVRTLDVPHAQPSPGQNPEQALRETCQLWVNHLWAEKDTLISQILADKNRL
jgi:1-acyl-sn-glycerol-3-phosphate acyltransferase